MNVPPPPPLPNPPRFAGAISGVPPPPPLPNTNYYGSPVSPPHFEQPLVAPRPQRLDPEIPANMARTLDARLSPPPMSTSNAYYRGPPPGAPSFAMPAPDRGPSPLPPPQGSDWAPWNIPRTNSPGSFNRGPSPSAQPAFSPPRPDSSQSAATFISQISSRSPDNAGAGPPALTAPLPTISSLIAGLSTAQNPSAPPASKLAWARDVLILSERMFAAAPAADVMSQNGLAEAQTGPINVTDPELLRLIDVAIPLVIQLAAQAGTAPNSQMPSHVSEALYWRASLESSGAYPQHVQPDPRSAFRDFERAARGGFHKAWFRLGRDYEGFNDYAHAKDCFERGIKRGDESCLYRMGMANLLGQLGLLASPEAAIPLLQRAATLATTSVPQPAYVFALLLLGEFAPAQLPQSAFYSLFPPGAMQQSPNPLDLEARKHLERAAYLHFAPAQYKLGHAYEFAQPPFPFDPLLSVQYYSLASQQGEVEADMALSKWFLCGAEGAFDKDEGLAYTFAEKAARKHLPAAEFAMGYYAEVGVGGEKNIDIACRWYERAAQHGNSDAQERLAALSQPAPQSLSRQQHDQLTETTLVRKRTQAKNRSDARGPQQMPHNPRVQSSQQIVANIRKNSLMLHPQGGAPGGGPAPYMPAVPEAGPGPNSGQVRLPPPQGGYGGPPPQNQPPYAPSGPQRARPEQPRYSLSDTAGGAPRPPQQSVPPPMPQQPAYPQGQPPPQGRPLRSASGSQLPPPQQQQQQQQQRPPLPHHAASSGTIIPRPPPGKGPATFQEMGFTSQKLEEKDCIIM